jgi:hypothetical protein
MSPYRVRSTWLGLALSSLVLLIGLSATAQASTSQCSMIETEAQLTRANKAVENGQAKELIWWDQASVKLRQAGRSGSLAQLRLHHPPKGRSHLAFDYGCPAVLEISHAKHVYACEPDAGRMENVCKKRWYYAGSKERRIRIDQPFQVRVPSDPDQAVDLSVHLPNLFIPEHYVLDEDWGTTNTLRFTG